MFFIYSFLLTECETDVRKSLEKNEKQSHCNNYLNSRKIIALIVLSHENLKKYSKLPWAKWVRHGR
jgi:hypothetical protein